MYVEAKATSASLAADAAPALARLAAAIAGAGLAPTGAPFAYVRGSLGQGASVRWGRNVAAFPAEPPSGLSAARHRSGDTIAVRFHAPLRKLEAAEEALLHAREAENLGPKADERILWFEGPVGGPEDPVRLLVEQPVGDPD